MAGDEAGLHALAGALGGMMALTATFPLMTVRAGRRPAARRHGGERGEKTKTLPARALRAAWARGMARRVRGVS